MASFSYVFILIALIHIGIAASWQWNCTALPAHEPSDITDLRPNNIKVVMALGDSITAAFGVRGSAGGLNETRGLSATIGGDSGAITIANFLKFYTPTIQGASLGTHLVEFCGGDLCPPDQYQPADDVLNAAQSGAMVVNLYPHEYSYLLKMLNSNPAINMQNDWKLLTIFIGANDLCASCVNNSFLHPDDYESRMINLLEEVRMNIPRTFVQLVELFNLSQVYTLSQTSPYCETVHRVSAFECGCILENPSNATLQIVDQYCQAYNAKSAAIAAKYQALNYAEFTVVSQPFGRNTMIENLPLQMLSTLDCFHPSLFAHQAMAVGLWNNMLTPAAKKKTALNLADVPICPTPDTLLYTN